MVSVSFGDVATVVEISGGVVAVSEAAVLVSVPLGDEVDVMMFSDVG